MSIISPGVHRKVTEAEFNNGYHLLFAQLGISRQLSRSSEFVQLSEDYYSSAQDFQISP